MYKNGKGKPPISDTRGWLQPPHKGGKYFPIVPMMKVTPVGRDDISRT